MGNSQERTYGATPEEVQKKIHKALEYGWSFEKSTFGDPTILPPEKFACRGWGGSWIKYNYYGIMVTVPSFLVHADIDGDADDIIMKGTR